MDIVEKWYNAYADAGFKKLRKVAYKI